MLPATAGAGAAFKDAPVLNELEKKSIKFSVLSFPLKSDNELEP